ncbi:MAG: hypothetical protein RJA19_625 [Bacteroidota bacterium]
MRAKTSLLHWTAIVGLMLALNPGAWGQIVWTDPPFPTQDDVVTLYYNANLGNGQLANVIPVYIHTGVITSASTGPSDWQHVQTNWGVANADYLLTPQGNGIHTFTFGGQTLASYYDLAPGEQIESLALVFRNYNGSLQGKNADGSDIFYAISDGGFAAQLITPEMGYAVLESGESITLQGVATEAAALRILINGDEVAAANGTGISHTFTAGDGGQYDVTLEATASGVTATDEAVITVLPDSPPTAVAPAGTQDGITYMSDSDVRLQLLAPNKDFVFVVGDFNNWQVRLDYLMNRTPDGQRYWLDLEGLTPGTEYRFQYHILPDDIRVADAYTEKVLDPWNDSWIPESTYPDLIPFPAGLTPNEPVSILHPGAPEYAWNDANFQRPPQEQLVIYELLVRDFTEERTFQSVIDTLDYLDSLGINALQLMPIMEFNGNDSWGYNTTFYMAVDKAYGPADKLRELVDACHQRGIAVILDLVFNHADQPNPFLKMYWTGSAPTPENPWFNVTAPHALNWFYDWNHESPHTRAFTKRVMEYWVESFHVDGFRWDFSQGMSQTPNGNGSYDQSRINILNDYGNHIWAQHPDLYMILEHWCTQSEETVLTNNGFMVWSNSTHDYQEAAMGYPSNLSWANYQSHGFSVPGAVSYAESHDEERLMYKNLQFGNGSGSYQADELATALDRMEAIQCFNILLPGPKMIWQFGELGYDYSINTCSDGVTVQESCRVEAKPVRWDYREDPDRYDVYRVVKALNHLKTQYPTFSSLNFNWDVGGFGKRLHLYHPDMDAVVVANFQVVTLNMVPGFSHTGTWYDYFTGEAIEVADIQAAMTFAPGEYHVYLDEPVVAPGFVQSVADASAFGGGAWRVWPQPASQLLEVELDLPQAGGFTARLLDAQGRVVRESQRQAYRPDAVRWQWELDGVAPGLYVLQVLQGGWSQSQRVLVGRMEN